MKNVVLGIFRVRRKSTERFHVRGWKKFQLHKKLWYGKQGKGNR